MGKIKKLQEKGTTILPMTVSDAVLMNSAEAGTLTAYVEKLKEGVDFITSIFGEDAEGDVFLKDREDGKARGLWTNSFLSSRGKDSYVPGGDSSGDDNGGGGSAGGVGLDVNQLWAELRTKDSSKVIDDSHISANIARSKDMVELREALLFKDIKG